MSVVTEMGKLNRLLSQFPCQFITQISEDRFGSILLHLKTKEFEIIRQFEKLIESRAFVIDEIVRRSTTTYFYVTPLV